MSGKASKLPMIAAVVALAAGCGGARPAQAPAPRIPRTVARDLAARSDAVAASLAQGDRCTAATQAAALKQAAHGAAKAGRLALVFRTRLLAAVDSLAAALPACPPPANTQKTGRAGEDGDSHDHGKHKGKGKGKHGDEGGD